MKLLLDTHVVLWWLNDHPNLRLNARQAIADPDHDVWVSAVSTFEVLNKHRLGKLPDEVAREYELFREKSAFPVLDVREAHFKLAATFAWSHRDPWDRILAAQAMLDDFTLVTYDTAFDEIKLDLIR